MTLGTVTMRTIAKTRAANIKGLCGQHRGFLGHKGVQGRSGSMPTLVSTSRTKMGDNQRGC